MKFKEVVVGQRLWFNSPQSNGYKNLGTVTRIDTDEDLNCPVVWIMWDKPRLEVGELCTTGDEYELGWEIADEQRIGLGQWMEARDE